jgi:hypothetical protein
MKQPIIVYDENLLNVVITGPLSKGGLLSITPEIFTITFACTTFKQNINDFELSLQFDNNDIINMYFSKECNTIGEVQEYFTFFYTLYYILLMIFFGFIFTFIYYYFKSNNLTLLDFFEQIKNKIVSLYIYMKSKFNKQNYKDEEHQTRESLYDEHDLVDVNIRTERVTTKYSSDYGGI